MASDTASKDDAPSSLSNIELRHRTVDGRGVADIRLMQVEDGPGRGQRLLIVRNAVGIGFEIAVDRGFDISSASWRGINIGWNSANGLPWPPNPVDAEDGIGIYRHFDGFLVTCGLDHVGGARTDDADRYIHKHRKQVFHPLHGRISNQRAMLSRYGIDWTSDVPVIRAEGVVRQSSIFGENLVLRRRIEVDVYGHAIRIEDRVENCGFRPTPHEILYHVNFGYPFLDATTEISGDLDGALIAEFNREDKRPRDDFVDYYQEASITSDQSLALVRLCSPSIPGGIRVELSFSTEALPSFGLWRGYQSGVYALGLEPAKRIDASEPKGNSDLQAGESVAYNLNISITGVTSTD